jgi:hypothetical protein
MTDLKLRMIDVAKLSDNLQSSSIPKSDTVGKPC